MSEGQCPWKSGEQGGWSCGSWGRAAIVHLSRAHGATRLRVSASQESMGDPGKGRQGHSGAESDRMNHVKTSYSQSAVTAFLCPHLWYTEVLTRGQIRAAAAGPHHSSWQHPVLTHWVRPDIEPQSSWILVGFVSSKPHGNSVSQPF